MVTEIKDLDHWSDELKKTAKVIVAFGAPWCAPCKKLEPEYEKCALTYSDYRFLHVNVDQNPEITDQYQVNSVPLILFFNQGQIVPALTINICDPVKLSQHLVTFGQMVP